jgi:hypothetical protein
LSETSAGYQCRHKYAQTRVKRSTIVCVRRTARIGRGDVDSHIGTPKLTKTIDRIMSFATGIRGYRRGADAAFGASHRPAARGRRNAMA